MLKIHGNLKSLLHFCIILTYNYTLTERIIPLFFDLWRCSLWSSVNNIKIQE